MRRRTERGLLVTALGIGLAASALVAVAKGAGLVAPDEGGLPVTFPQVIAVWAQVAVAVLATHVLLALRHPTCDQYLLPISVALTGLGLAVIFALAPDQAERQVGWLYLSLAGFAAVVVGLRDVGTLRRYKYTWGAVTVLLLVLPLAIGRTVHGSRLWISLGPLTVQPGELAKLSLVLFAAGYLSTRGELLAAEPRRIGPFAVPEPRLMVPLMVMWAVAMLLLVRLRDLGTALLFFAVVVAMLYAATDRAAWLGLGAVSFAGGAWVCAQLFGHVHRRITAWLDPWSDVNRSGFQVAQGLFAIAAGGLSGAGLGLGQAWRIPEAATDYPFAAVCEDLGLWGAAVLAALYVLWVQRALHTALRCRDRFIALLAVGLGSLMAVQTLVILAGVTKLIPLTGITLPFVSYGGSSLLTNYLALGLLLRCGEEQP